MSEEKKPKRFKLLVIASIVGLVLFLKSDKGKELLSVIMGDSEPDVVCVCDDCTCNDGICSCDSDCECPACDHPKACSCDDCACEEGSCDCDGNDCACPACSHSE